MTTPQIGDVIRYTPTDGRHCREGVAVGVQRGGEVIFVDTFWGSLSDAHVLTATEVATGELLFTLTDFDELNQNHHGRRATWERYAVADRQHIPSQHGLQARYFIRKGASESIAQQVLNARADVVTAEDAVRSAHRRLERAQSQLLELLDVSS